MVHIYSFLFVLNHSNVGWNLRIRYIVSIRTEGKETVILCLCFYRSSIFHNFISISSFRLLVFFVENPSALFSSSLNWFFWVLDILVFLFQSWYFWFDFHFKLISFVLNIRFVDWYTISNFFFLLFWLHFFFLILFIHVDNFRKYLVWLIYSSIKQRFYKRIEEENIRNGLYDWLISCGSDGCSIWKLAHKAEVYASIWIESYLFVILKHCVGLLREALVTWRNREQLGVHVYCYFLSSLNIYVYTKNRLPCSLLKT